MIVKIDEYCLKEKIVSLALSEESFKILREEKKDCMYLSDQILYFFPDGATINVSKDTARELGQCDSFDVFYINENGRAYKYYDNESSDNAIMITDQCNSNCIMCPASDRNRRHNSAESIDMILQIIKHIPTDAKHITITGGEPFLVGEKIFDVFQALKSRLSNTSFLLLTNGRALSYRPFYEKFQQTLPSKTIIGIPLHGFDAQTHDYITRAEGSFEQTKAGIKNLLALGFDVELRMVVSKLNYHYLDKISKLIVSEFPTVHRVMIMGLEMTGNAAKNKEQVWIPYREAFIAAKPAINILIKHSIQVGLYNFPLCSIDQAYYNIAAKSISEQKVRFMPECDMCNVKDACGGLFAGTIRLAKSDVRPVI